jgi:hypothetical protein
MTKNAAEPARAKVRGRRSRGPKATWCAAVGRHVARKIAPIAADFLTHAVLPLFLFLFLSFLFFLVFLLSLLCSDLSFCCGRWLLHLRVFSFAFLLANIFAPS